MSGSLSYELVVVRYKGRDYFGVAIEQRKTAFLRIGYSILAH